jgi:aryl-alcohol dehydrogenase-like predicted oxidoreductase
LPKPTETASIASHNKTREAGMIGKIRFGKTDLQVSPLVLGTWVTGGWAWGGSDEKESLAAILRALELGINFIDTAPVYGFGKSEQIVGKALKEWGEKVVVATKCGLEWDAKERIRRNSSPERILQEVDDSLKRLGVDCIDLYQIHWPDPAIPFEDTMKTLLKVQEVGKIRYIGVSNFSRDQLREFMQHGPVYSLQPPYNVFEREAEKELLPFCAENGIAALAYGGLCRGLLTGKFKGNEHFPKGDLRRADPKFKPDRFKKYTSAVNEIKAIAASYNKSPAQFALRWALQQPGITCVIAGARTATQAEDNIGVGGWMIKPQDLQRVDEVLAEKIPEPVDPGFMAPKKN